jgi:hypothetical protein
LRLSSVQHTDVTKRRMSCFYATLNSLYYLLLTEMHVESEVTEFRNVKFHACFGVVTKLQLWGGGEVSMKEESSCLTDKHQKTNCEKNN